MDGISMELLTSGMEGVTKAGLYCELSGVEVEGWSGEWMPRFPPPVLDDHHPPYQREAYAYGLFDCTMSRIDREMLQVISQA